MYFVLGINRNQALISGLVSYNKSLNLKTVQINHTHVDSGQLEATRSKKTCTNKLKEIPLASSENANVNPGHVMFFPALSIPCKD